MCMVLNLLWRDESGATAIEYGLIAALVSVAIIGALAALGDSLETVFNFINDSLTEVMESTQSS